MSNKSHFFRQSVLAPINNPLIYIKSSQGVIQNNGFISSVMDLSGNGYNFDAINNPTIIQNGINGLPSIRFQNGSYLQNLDNLVQRINKDIVFTWVVWQRLGVHQRDASTVYTQGANYESFDSTILWLNQFPVTPTDYKTTRITTKRGELRQDLSLDNDFEPAYALVNKKQTSLDLHLSGNKFSTRNGTQTIGDKIFIGSWADNHSDSIISEFGMLNYNPTAQQIQDLKDYFTNTYNL